MRPLRSVVLALVLPLVLPGRAGAEADGPDFYRVEIEGAGAIVPLFAEPGGTGAPIASIPDGADGLANRGCEGGLSYAEWVEASEEERAAAAGRRWCRVVYGPVEGWVQGIHLREGGPSAEARAPSFDCARASTGAEIAICRSDQLAALDLEVARLYGLALEGPGIGGRAAELKAYQRGWIKGRDDCWKAGAGLADCIAFAHLARIEDLRSRHADARSVDDAGISLGPLPFVCEGLSGVLRATFVRAPEPLALITWGQEARMLTLTPAASGARYADAETVFWTRGTGEGAEALLSVAGDADRVCRRDRMD